MNIINYWDSTYLPVDVFEEGMGFYVLDALLSVPQSVLRVPLEQHTQQRLCFRREKLWHPQLCPGGCECVCMCLCMRDHAYTYSVGKHEGMVCETSLVLACVGGSQ